jgi:hypothetical protein
MKPRRCEREIAIAVAVAAVLAITGCSRSLTPASAYAADAVVNTQPVYADQAAAPYQEDPAAAPCAQPMAGYVPPSYDSRYGVRMVRPRQVVVQPLVYEQRREVRHGRSTGRSVAIVAGSAGVGAAIGAIAGGGKGAGIGAIAGGSGGFIYDRMTHNR